MLWSLTQHNADIELIRLWLTKNKDFVELTKTNERFIMANERLIMANENI